ncbi:mitochondrial calcium uniporter regulator 1 [Solea solea]|uniref:mitochondrial calcium uniporter regulator 1 n=1 Tax=Solea solea TaxID=90069 RepID=UPI00272C3C9A|nr:mitochondrial calcium uniporter regulator 1 [Solea solea]
MVLKQCHSRIKPFIFKHPEKKWCEPCAFSRDLVSSSLPTVSTLTAVNASPCSGCEESRTQGASGRRSLYLSAGTHVSVRELSTSTRTFQYDVKTNKLNSDVRKLFFDTHAVVRLLEENGFTTMQAEVIVKVLVKMTNSNMDIIYNDMVTKVQQERMLQHVMSQIAAVRKDMIILEKSEFSALLAENEKLKIQLLQLKVQLSDIINKMRSDNILDMNIEKSRVKELKAQHERKLLETRSEIMEMTAEHDRHLTQTNMRIDTEVAGLKTMLESHKLDTIKYLAGSVFTCLTVVMGFYRIWM